jgi:hypothetical protein
MRGGPKGKVDVGKKGGVMSVPFWIYGGTMMPSHSSARTNVN